MVHDVTIVGSGVAGVAAALRLADHGIRCLIVDVGIQPNNNAPLRENFYKLRQRKDLFELMIGRDFERVQCISRDASPVPAKLTAPRIRYVSEESQRYGPVQETNYAAVQSFAAGGLANAWGAGLYRYSARDLQGFPVDAPDLSPYYDRLDREIGVSGEYDDLARYFGETGVTQPPLRLSRKAEWLMARYARKRVRLNRKGVFLGRPRLGVLSEPWSGRPGCDYSNLEFWQPELPYIYNPTFTLRRLIRDDFVTYRRGLLVRSWSANGQTVTVRATGCDSGAGASFETKWLLLAAGAIGSGRLALASREDFSSRLDLLDNPTIQFPLMLLRFIGKPLETDCFGLTQLNLVYDVSEDESPLQASILEITSPARSEFFSSLPLAARDNLCFIRHLVPAMLVMQLFLPARPGQAAKLSLGVDGKMRIEGPPVEKPRELVRSLVRVMRKLGVTTHGSLAVYPPPGHGVHYAGTLPMSESPSGPYQCDRYCRLFGSRNVYVVDGAAFPRLPAKNYSYTMMANAMRVADHVAQCVKDQHSADEMSENEVRHQYPQA